MPLPLIPVAIGVAALVTAAGSYIKYKKKPFYSLAILGAKSTGKTTLYNYLTNSDSKEATGGGEKTKKHKFKIRDIEIGIDEGVDISGSEDFVPMWEGIIDKTNTTFYMINSEKVLSQEKKYLDLVEKHLYILSKLYENKSRKDKVILICSFADKVAEQSLVEEELEMKLYNYLKNLINIDTLLVVGSLKEDLEKEELVYKIFKNYS